MPERWYGGFFMTVALHGMNYRYRFRVKGKRYFGLCVNCHTEEEALALNPLEIFCRSAETKPSVSAIAR